MKKGDLLIFIGK